MPKLDKLLLNMESKLKYIAKIDLNNAFHQLKTTEENQGTWLLRHTMAVSNTKGLGLQ